MGPDAEGVKRCYGQLCITCNAVKVVCLWNFDEMWWLWFILGFHQISLYSADWPRDERTDFGTKKRRVCGFAQGKHKIMENSLEIARAKIPH